MIEVVNDVTKTVVNTTLQSGWYGITRGAYSLTYKHKENVMDLGSQKYLSWTAVCVRLFQLLGLGLQKYLSCIAVFVRLLQLLGLGLQKYLSCIAVCVSWVLKNTKLY